MECVYTSSLQDAHLGVDLNRLSRNPHTLPLIPIKLVHAVQVRAWLRWKLDFCVCVISEPVEKKVMKGIIVAAECCGRVTWKSRWNFYGMAPYAPSYFPSHLSESRNWIIPCESEHEKPSLKLFFPCLPFHFKSLGCFERCILS